jgi:methyl-accepting chemotaxis protein
MMPLTDLENIILEQPLLLGSSEPENTTSNELIEQISQTIEQVSQTINRVSQVIEQVSQTINHLEQVIQSIH